jgi:hypothetical protein
MKGLVQAWAAGVNTGDVHGGWMNPESRSCYCEWSFLSVLWSVYCLLLRTMTWSFIVRGLCRPRFNPRIVYVGFVQNEEPDINPCHFKIWGSTGVKIGVVISVLYHKHKRYFLFSTASRPALGPIQPPIQWVLWTHSSGAEAAGAWSWPLSYS